MMVVGDDGCCFDESPAVLVVSYVQGEQEGID